MAHPRGEESPRPLPVAIFVDVDVPSAIPGTFTIADLLELAGVLVQ